MILWEKNYGTIEKTMVLWEKLWFFGKNDRTIPKTMETFIYFGENYGTIERVPVNFHDISRHTHNFTGSFPENVQSLGDYN